MRAEFVHVQEYGGEEGGVREGIFTTSSSFSGMAGAGIPSELPTCVGL